MIKNEVKIERKGVKRREKEKESEREREGRNVSIFKSFIYYEDGNRIVSNTNTIKCVKRHTHTQNLGPSKYFERFFKA